MTSDTANRLNNFSRRHLLTALGGAAALRPATVFAQGQCGGARAGTPACDRTPAKLPFAPTGWKTVLLDRFTCDVADYSKEAAFYAALMNWKIRSDDGKQALMDIGDWGGLLLRGGYRPTAGAPRHAWFNSFCWGIEPWDARSVEAELRNRGLTPFADNYGEFQSFHVKDPDGFDVQISNGNRTNRRQTPATGGTSAPAPFAATDWKTVWLDHISFTVPDYKKSVAFYSALLGWKPGMDEGSQNQCEIGDVGDIIIRRGGGAGLTGPGTGHRAAIGHISFGITPFDPDRVKAELTKRGLTAREDTGGRGDIHTASFKSYHTTTPNGFDLQISATTKANRNPS
jgi:catechol 2,3-dioxygenase-like lactoylglutathione lyase family enzyme